MESVSYKLNTNFLSNQKRRRKTNKIKLHNIYFLALQDTDVFEITDFTTASDWER